MNKELKEIVKPGSEEEKLAKQIDKSNLPQHVAIIMDGNGRWAKKRKLPRLEGHRAGANTVQEIVEACAYIGIKILTLYAFSKENWKRPKKEVETLWRLLEEYLKKEDKVLIENNLCFKVIGQRDGIPKKVKKQIERVEKLTESNTRMTVILAINYGGRSEIIDAIKRLIKEKDIDIDNLTEEKFSEYLYTANLPDPDLLIRTSGELRISNFLLWQIAYSEIWITKIYWPDFQKKNIFQAFIDYQVRERRYGDISVRSE